MTLTHLARPFLIILALVTAVAVVYFAPKLIIEIVLIVLVTSGLVARALGK